jgi:hypothetical protein
MSQLIRAAGLAAALVVATGCHSSKDDAEVAEVPETPATSDFQQTSAETTPDKPAREPTPAKDFAMKVTTVRYFSTNPSLPPQYVTEDQWLLRPEHVDDWDALIGRVLDETKVNDAMTVREHAQALANGDEATLKLLAPDPNVAIAHPSGAPSITFTLLDGADVVYEFDSDLEYTGEAFSELRTLVKEKGQFTESKPGETVPPGP